MTTVGLPFQGHHQRREAEWVGALVLFGVAVALLLPGATFSRPTFDAFGAIAPEGTWGATLLGVALIRMIALAKVRHRHRRRVRLERVGMAPRP